jgi:hypothetical protein
MNLTTTFTTTPSSVLRSYRACHRVAYAVRCAFAILLVVTGLVLLNVIPVVIGIVYFGFAGYTVRRQLKPYLSGPRTVTVTLTDDDYRTESGDRTIARTWSTFTRVQRVGQLWILRVSNLAAISLPVDALDQAQTAEFTALMQSKGLLKS